MFTPTEQRILEELADGMPRKKDQLRAVIDEMCTDVNLAIHISNMRARLNLQGQDIVCVSRGHHVVYQWVRLLGNPYNGYH